MSNNQSNLKIPVPVWCLAVIVLGYLILIMPYSGFDGLFQAMLYYWVILPIAGITFIVWTIKNVLLKKYDSQTFDSAGDETTKKAAISPGFFQKFAAVLLLIPVVYVVVMVIRGMLGA